MRMLLVGALGMLALKVLLEVGAYMMRMTPEVVNCDRGRQSVEVHIEESFRAYVTNLDSLRCEMGK
jgi:hypothetical protein